MKVIKIHNHSLNAEAFTDKEYFTQVFGEKLNKSDFNKVWKQIQKANGVSDRGTKKEDSRD